MKFDVLLYAVTDRAWVGGMSLEEQVEEALKAGVTLVQLREKGLEDEQYIERAVQIKRITDRYDIPLIINDNVRAALASDAAGAHVGQADSEAGLVRQMLGADKILGVTVGNVEQALRAQAQGADYLGCGAVFNTKTKRDAHPLTREELQEITATVKIPVVAIGGINRDNIMQLQGTGVAGAAIVSGIFGEESIRNAVKELKLLVQRLTGR